MKNRKPKSPEFHGMTGAPEYEAWRNLLWLGSLNGTTVCRRWRQFGRWLKDVGRRPTANHIFVRLDLTKDYMPGNAVWLTWSEAHQRRPNGKKRLVPYSGRMVSCAELARIRGVAPHTMRQRIARGWDPADAANRPVRAHQRSN